MTTGRRNFVTRLTVLFVVAQLLAIAAKIEQWPLSYYPMFSKRQASELRWNVFYGVTAGGEELKLQDSTYWSPFSAVKLSYALARARVRDEKQSREGTAKPPALPLAVEQALGIYERRRASAKHKGPPLVGLRLYEVTWRVDPALKNLDQPEQRKLLVDHDIRR
jgi:hypothetical protein